MELVAVAVLLVVVAAGSYLMYQQQMGHPRRIAARVASMPVTTLGEVDAPGPGRLTGVARALDVAPASPVSGRAYLALDVMVQAHSDGVSRRTHRTAVDFLLDDGTGVALVRAAGEEIPVVHDHESQPTSLDRVDFADQVLRAGGVSIGSPSTCQVRMWEGVLQPGSTIGVVGRVEPADAAARAVGAGWVVRGHDDVRLLVRPEPPGAAPHA